MRDYPVIIDGGIAIPALARPTEQLGVMAITVKGYPELLGHTARMGPHTYIPIVRVDGEDISLPATHRRLEAIGDIVRYLDGIHDERLDLKWRQSHGSIHQPTPQSPDKEVEM